MKILLFLFGIIATAMAADYDPDMILREGNRQFTAKMYSEVAKRHPNENLIQSAYSVLTPLAQLSLASVGESHDELLRAIGLPNDNVTKEVFSQANKRLKSIKGVELKMASKMYIPVNYHINRQFNDVSRELFDTEVENIDFLMSEKAAHTINAWVEDHTNKRIKDLINPSSCTPDTRAILVNAIYFKGNWKDKFSEYNTKDRDFYVTKDKTTKIPFMYQKTFYLYGRSEELDATLLQMPYKGEETQFLVILPTSMDGLPALEEKLRKPALLEDAISKMRSEMVHLYLPKFKIETTIDLKEVLINMNVNKVFTESEAKLDHLLDGSKGLYVSDAMQKAFIEVNEGGAEAAAANKFAIAVTSSSTTFMYLGREFTFDANHPFIFSIRMNGTELFTGRFVK